WLAISRAPGRTRAVFGALDDKDAAGIARILAPYVEAWYLAGLDRDSPRGLAAQELAARIAGPLEGAPLSLHPDVAGALAAAGRDARPGDRMLAFGSFFVAAAALEFAEARGAQDGLAAIQLGAR